MYGIDEDLWRMEMEDEERRRLCHEDYEFTCRDPMQYSQEEQQKAALESEQEKDLLEAQALQASWRADEDYEPSLPPDEISSSASWVKRLRSSPFDVQDSSPTFGSSTIRHEQPEPDVIPETPPLLSERLGKTRNEVKTWTNLVSHINPGPYKDPELSPTIPSSVTTPSPYRPQGSPSQLQSVVPNISGASKKTILLPITQPVFTRLPLHPLPPMTIHRQLNVGIEAGPSHSGHVVAIHHPGSFFQQAVLRASQPAPMTPINVPDPAAPNIDNRPSPIATVQNPPTPIVVLNPTPAVHVRGRHARRNQLQGARRERLHDIHLAQPPRPQASRMRTLRNRVRTLEDIANNLTRMYSEMDGRRI